MRRRVRHLIAHQDSIDVEPHTGRREHSGKKQDTELWA